MDSPKTETELIVDVVNPLYSCGKCYAKFERRSKNESPRCPNCGYRIIEKIRTTKPVQFLAR